MYSAPHYYIQAGLPQEQLTPGYLLPPNLLPGLIDLSLIDMQAGLVDLDCIYSNIPLIKCQNLVS